MPATVVVTRNVEARYRGFLASIMLEIAPGVYLAPELSAGVRERVWNVVNKWYAHLGSGSITLIFVDSSATGGLRIDHLGEPPKEIWDADGLLLVRKEIGAMEEPEELPF